jgi:hypothetical protein
VAVRQTIARTPDGSKRSVTIVREEGELLLVSHGARLRDVCVKCATRDGMGRRFELMHHGVARALVVFALCFVASTLVTIVLSLGLLTTLGLESVTHWLSILGLTISVFVAGRRLRLAAVDLPICPTCDSKWRVVLRARRLATLSIVLVMVLPIAVHVAELRGRFPRGTARTIALGLALAWVGMLATFRVGKWRDRTVTAKAIHGELIFLRGVHPDARRALVAEAAAADSLRRIPPE